MRISRAVLIAIDAIRKLTEGGGSWLPSSASRENREELPERLLLVISENLAVKRILAHDCGGGYMLARRPEDISLLDLIEGVDGPVIGITPDEVGLPDEVRLNLRNICNAIAMSTRDKLRRVTIADLLSASRTSSRSEPMWRQISVTSIPTTHDVVSQHCQRGLAKREQAATHLLSVEDLIAVKRFVESVGSIQQARAAIDALANYDLA